MRGLSNFPSKRVGRSTAIRMMTPPIVGVPLFFIWDSGPVERISSPIWFLCSMWITQGPIMKLMNSAAIDADAERNVMYSNRLKNDIESLNGVNIS